MANAKTPDGEHLDFDELFAGEQPPAPKGESGKENLQELEAFLDDFEKGLGEAKPAPNPAVPAASFTEPHEAEELVHGLLKEDELNLDVDGAAAKAAADQGVEEFEPHPLTSTPLDIPAFIHAAPAANGKPVPAAAAGFSRIGFILALVLAGAALLIALGAGWMALNATQAVQGMELAGAPAGADPRIAKLQSDVSALRKQVDDLSKAVEGSLSDLSGRVALLEKQNGSAPATAGAAAVGPAAPADGKSESPKNAAAKPPAPEPPKAAAKPAGPVAPPPEAAKAQPPKPVVPKAPATTTSAPAPKEPVAAATPPTGQAPVAGPPAGAAAGAAAPATTPAPVSPGAAAVPAPTKETPKAQPAPVGGWVVHLTSADEKKRAQAQLDHARAKGLAARLTTGLVAGKTWYRVTVEGFTNADEARAFASKQAVAAGFSSAWIGQK